MIGLALVGALALGAATPAGSAAPAAPAGSEKGTPTAQAAVRAPAQGPDLELHVPKAEVEKVSLEVENLQARLDLDTRVANLVQINAGVIATVQKLKLELEGMQAEAHLVVRLDRVAEVMERALGTIDHNPGVAGTTAAQASPTAAANAGRPSSLAEQATARAPNTQPVLHKE